MVALVAVLIAGCQEVSQRMLVVVAVAGYMGVGGASGVGKPLQKEPKKAKREKELRLDRRSGGSWWLINMGLQGGICVGRRF